MYKFPSTEGFLKSKDESELIYGASVAINRILGYLRETVTQPSRYFPKIYLVNLYTLYANVYNPKLSEIDMLNSLKNEIETLSLYIGSYVTHDSSRKDNISLIFYLPDYHILEFLKNKVRDKENSTDKLNALYKKTKGSLFPNHPTRLPSFDEDRFQRYFLPVGKNYLPYKEIVTWLSFKENKVKYSLEFDQVAVLTHCPIDLHLYRHIRNISLLERYTGQVLTIKQFGKKLSGVDARKISIPFNQYTHKAFGDSLHITPLLDKKQKKLILEDSEKKNWFLLTEKNMLDTIIKLTGIKYEDMNNFRIV